MSNFDEQKAYEYLRDNKVVVNILTEDECDEFICFVEKYCYYSTLDKSGWIKYGKLMCYNADFYNAFYYGNTEYYKNKNYKIITFQELKDMFQIEKFLKWNQLEEGVEYEGYINDSKKLEFKWIGQFGYTKYIDEYGYSTGNLDVNELLRMKFKPLKQPKEMTIEEVCKELGYDIKIVKGE